MATNSTYARLNIARLNAFRLDHLEPGAKAILDARSNVARSNASRSNYFSHVNVLIEIGGVDYSRYLRHGTLTVHTAINDEPDTAGFTLVPDVPSYPAIGAEVRIGLGAASNLEFGGRVVQLQHRREAARNKPFINVFCCDWLPDFDQRIVSYSWIKQSASTTILDLIARFCQHQLDAPFSTARVVADLPVIEALSVVNQRPSTIMRKIAASIGGGFYVDPSRVVHAWSGVVEPDAADPRALSLDAITLKQFAHNEDATQVRTVVVVEGARTSTLAGLPNTPGGVLGDGFPIADSTLFRSAPIPFEMRVGSQRLRVTGRISPAYDATKPRGAKLSTDTVPGPTYVGFVFADMTFISGRPQQGWFEVEGKFYMYYGYDDSAGPNAGGYAAVRGYADGWGGTPATPIKAGTAVTLVDYVYGVVGTEAYVGSIVPNTPIAAQVIDADVVLVVRKATAAVRAFPSSNVEHFVADGRYSYQGAVERAHAELAQFDHVDVAADWETDDPNARPGRRQIVALEDPDALSATFMIQSADLSFPVANRAPLRQCHGGAVKRANLLDLLVTEKD